MNVPIKQYYDEHNAAFLIRAINLFVKSDIHRILKNFNFIGEVDRDKKQKMLHDFSVYVTDIDEYTFQIIKLSVALEFSLKGIAISQGFNIFDFNKKKLESYFVFSEHIINDDTRTLNFNLFLDESNLKKIIGDNNFRKYHKAFEFFRYKRNEYIHSSKMEYKVNHNEHIENLVLLKDYFDNVVMCMRDEEGKKNVKRNN